MSPLNIAEAAALDFDALLTGDEVREIESIATSFGTNRRLVLSTLTHSKAELTPVNDEEALDALMMLYESIKEYKVHLGHLTEQAETAEARLLSVLCAAQQRMDEPRE